MPQVTINEYQISHDFPYDPTYGYGLKELLAVPVPPEVEGFADFWKERYERARNHTPTVEMKAADSNNRWRVMDVTYSAHDGFIVGGWLLLPTQGEVKRAFVMGHGYGGREAPELEWPFSDAAILFPCARGFHRSAHPSLPSDAMNHVVHGIDDPSTYLIGSCVEDLWHAVSVLANLFPEAADHIAYAGGSFGGGLGALALAWEKRFQRAQFGVPTFGCQGLRLQLPTGGSGLGVQQYAKKHPEIVERTLPYYDAAVAARHITVPTLCACALFDPAVAPPGQFGVYNALSEHLRSLFVLAGGHIEFPGVNGLKEQERHAAVEFLNKK